MRNERFIYIARKKYILADFFLIFIENVLCFQSSIANADQCPRITNYTVVKEGDDTVYDSTGVVYFSRDRNYTINITGANLVDVRK